MPKWIKWPKRLDDGGFWINLDEEVEQQVDKDFWWQFAKRSGVMETYEGEERPNE